MQMLPGFAFLLTATLGLRLARASSECSSGWGKAPKYDDSSCKSFWYCEDYYGRVEHCPHGYQFHYESKECMKDEDVFCKWQLSSYHSSDTSSGSSSSLGSSHGPWSRDCHEEHGTEPDHEAEHCETYYSCRDHYGTLQHCPHGHQFDFHDKECREDKYVYCQEQRTSHSSHSSHSEHGHHESGHSSSMTSHDCHEEHGTEPDHEAEHCETYYSCHDHHGTLQHCPHGHQFDFHDKECREDKYVYCQEQRTSHSSHSSHADDHHHSSSSGVDDSLYYMLAMNGVGGLDGGAGGVGGGNGVGGGLLGGLGVPAAAAAAAALLNIQGNAGVLPIQGNAGVLPIQGNAGVLPIQGNARVLPIQGNALQGVAPNQIGFPPNQLANLPNQIGFPPNQFGVLPNQVGGVGQLLPGLGLAANPLNVGGANVNQIQLAGAAGPANGVAASQDQSALLSNGVLNAQGAAPVGQTAVNQDQKIVTKQQGGTQTTIATKPDDQGRQPDPESAQAGGQPSALPPLVIPGFPAVQVLTTRPVSPPVLQISQSLPPGGVQTLPDPPLQGQVQASAKANAQVEGGGAPDSVHPVQVPKPVAERVTTPFWWLLGDHATLPPLDISNGPWLVPDAPSNPWVPVELPNTQGK